jgi:hypothetical protein
LYLLSMLLFQLMNCLSFLALDCANLLLKFFDFILELFIVSPQLFVFFWQPFNFLSQSFCLLSSQILFLLKCSLQFTDLFVTFQRFILGLFLPDKFLNKLLIYGYLTFIVADHGSSCFQWLFVNIQPSITVLFCNL